METINVQFGDSTETAIVAYFACAQDPAVYANIGTVDASDSRWKAFYEYFSPASQQLLPTPT